MQSHEQSRNMTETPKPRFQIVKLEERIAPHHRLGHYPKGHDCGPYDYYCDGPGRKVGHNKGGWDI